MGDWPLRARLRLPAEGGRGRKDRPISDDSRAIEELLPEHFYSSRWLWHMTMKLLLDDVSAVAFGDSLGLYLRKELANRMELSLDHRNEPIGPPITTGIRQLIEG
jgi:hypothetical protein